MADEKFLTRREFVTAMVAVGGSAAVALALSEIEPLEDLIEREIALELPEVEREVAHESSDYLHRLPVLRLCVPGG
jgi:hypothetical protein